MSWHSINTNARTWGQDGASFIPERWLPDPEMPDTPAELPHATLGGWQHLSTFSEGPRICLGYRLAVFEAKALIIALIRDFKFGSVQEVPILSPAPVGEKNASRVSTGEKIRVKIKKTFCGMTFPHIEDGEKAGMSGIWLPVKVSLADDIE